MYRLRKLLSMLSVSVVLAQLPGNGERIERAIQLTRAKRYSEAASALEGVQEPRQPAQRVALHRLRAAIASGLGRFPQAADEMEKALTLAPGPALLLPTAVAEFQAGRRDAAIEHVSAARLNGQTAATETLLGDILEARGDPLEAVHAYQRAVALAPDDEQPRLNLAIELVRHRTFGPAELVLRQGLDRFPQSYRMRVLQGIAFYAGDRPAEAMEALVEAVRADPDAEPAYRYLADFALQNSGVPDGSVAAVFRAFAARHPDNTRAAAVCAALELRSARAAGDTTLESKSRETLKRSAALAPRDPIIRCELGRAYEWQQRWADARTEMEACAALAPLPGNHYRLARIYQRLGLEELAHRELLKQQDAVRLASEEAQLRDNAVQSFVYEMKRQ